MLEPSLIPDLVLSAAAATGLVIVRGQIAQTRDGVAWRFRLILLVTALFYGLRALEWMTGIGLMRALTLITAAIIPFVALLLAEGMLRRHAPRQLKSAAAVGMALFSLAALIVPLTRSPAFLALFLGYQLLLFSSAFWLLARRDRKSLSTPENRLSDRVLWAGPVLLVLLASDYVLAGAFGLPALSALGALILAWLASTFEARAASGPFTALAVVAVLCVAGLGAWVLGLRHDWPWQAVLETWAMWAALILSLMVFLSSTVLRRARARASLTATLNDPGTVTEFLDALEARGLTDGFVLLGEDDLRDYDAQGLLAHLGAAGRATRADLPQDPAQDSLAQSQFRALLDQFAAREALLISQTPLRLAVGTPNRLAEGTAAEIQAGFAIARLIAERDAATRPQP